MAFGPKFTTLPEFIGTFGAVSSTHWLATAVGMSMLDDQQSAMPLERETRPKVGRRPVATGFVLQIVEPHLSGPRLGSASSSARHRTRLTSDSSAKRLFFPRPTRRSAAALPCR
jgi:hypothetical protein